jgi:4,5-dihydroxyphthalate decarboxylase
MTRLTAMLGSYPNTAPLKDGRVRSAVVGLDFADVDIAQRAFKDVVRSLAYDVAELALMTFLVAYEAGKPYVLLPFVMNGNFHHKSILCRADSDLRPEDLSGKRVAMRSYSQTTPTWVRGFLADDYGVSVPDVRWISQEGAHVAEYTDPEWVSRDASGRGLEQMLLSGDVEAIISGGGLSGDDRIRTLIPRPREAALAWHRRTNAVPINHMVAIRREIAESGSELVHAVLALLEQSRSAAGDRPTSDGPDATPSGFDAIAVSLELGIRYAFDQRLITTAYAPDELYGPVEKALA